MTSRNPKAPKPQSPKPQAPKSSAQSPKAQSPKPQSPKAPDIWDKVCFLPRAGLGLVPLVGWLLVLRIPKLSTVESELRRHRPASPASSGWSGSAPRRHTAWPPGWPGGREKNNRVTRRRMEGESTDVAMVHNQWDPILGQCAPSILVYGCSLGVQGFDPRPWTSTEQRPDLDMTQLSREKVEHWNRTNGTV